MQKLYGVRELSNWVLDYADSLGHPITNMALNKLLFFVYEHSLLMHGRKLTGAKIEAWEHGPVFREVYRSFKDHENRPITTRSTKYNPAIDQVEQIIPEIDLNDEIIVREALEPIIHLPASILREISHDSRGPWAAVWHHSGQTNPGMQITDDLIIKQSAERHRVND